VDFLEQLEQGRYGSFELKKLVGPNLIKGLIISIFIHSVVIASPYIVKLIRGEEEIPPIPIRVVDISQLTKLKSQQNTNEQVVITQPKLAAPKAALPIAVPEEQVDKDQALLPTQQDITTQVAATPGEELGLNAGEKIEITGDVATSEDIPPMEKFISFEVAPQPLPDFSPQPKYPDIAQEARTPGKVIAYVYVDKNGVVKKFKIVKAVPKGLGFEEEVEKVIMKWKFTPAIQQGHPIGVWVSVPFNFKVTRQ
jgi:TonB family protein